MKTNKKILFIIAGKNFRDIEYFKPREILENSGVDIKVASNIRAGEFARGSDGGEVKIDFNINEVNVPDFDLIIFVGGPGALECLDNEESYEIAREAVELKKKLAAICIAPVILAKAGVLRNKKAVVWHNEMNKEAIKILEEKGVNFVNKTVVEDGDIITAVGPDAAEDFGKKLKSVLTNEV